MRVKFYRIVTRLSDLKPSELQVCPRPRPDSICRQGFLEFGWKWKYRNIEMWKWNPILKTILYLTILRIDTGTRDTQAALINVHFWYSRFWQFKDHKTEANREWWAKNLILAWNVGFDIRGFKFFQIGPNLVSFQPDSDEIKETKTRTLTTKVN